MAASLSVGYAAAGSAAPAVQERGGGDTYSVTQGENCFEISPVTGDEPVKSFYDYRTPFADNPYTNATGKSYSSEGTTVLQRPNGSALFLYQDGTGNLSLVFVHGATHNASTGGSVSFDITGLPEDGTWAVKDDEYDGENNYDQWNRTPGTTQANWTWGAEKTDGGAYAGLGDEFEITIDPAFNRSAALYGEYYNGTVENWTAVSNGAGNFDRTQLGMSQPVTISSGGCEDADAAASGASDDGDEGLAGAIGGDDAAGDDAPDDDAADDDETDTDERDDGLELPDDGNDTDENVTDPGENVTDGNESDGNVTAPDGNETDGDVPEENETGDETDGNESDGVTDPPENDTDQNGDDTDQDGNDTDPGDDDTDGNEFSDDGNESSDDGTSPEDGGADTGDDATNGDGDATNGDGAANGDDGGDDDGPSDGSEDQSDDSGADGDGSEDSGAEDEETDDDGTADDGTDDDGTDATGDESEAESDEEESNAESGDDGEAGGNETSP